MIGESGDGLVFAAVGLRADTASSNKFSSSKLANQGGSISAAIPARTGLAMRLRAPFYLVPGDVLLLAPLYLLAPDAYTSMAVTASNGGLLPWQVGWATPIGRFQFVAGRELGVTLYGIGSSDQLIAPAATAGSPPRLVDFESMMRSVRDHGYEGWISVEHDKADKLGGDYAESTAISRWYAKNVLDRIYAEAGA